MNASYKIALLAAVGLLVLVVGYYATRGPGPDNLTQLTPADAEVETDAAGEGDGEPAARPLPEAGPSPRRETPRGTPTTGQPTPRRTTPATNERAEGVGTPTSGAVVEIGPPPTDPLITLRNPRGELIGSGNATTEPPARSEPIVRATPEPPVTTVTTDPATTPPVGATPVAATPEPTPPPVVETPPTRPFSDDPATTEIYTVQAGDMLVHIAERFYGSQAAWEDIAQANPTVDPTRLRVGQELRLPAPAVAERTRTEPPAPRPGTRERYTVKPGDNLTRIAERFYGDADQWDIIYNHNRDAIGPDPGRLKAGMTLDIPPAVAGAN